MCQGDLKPEHIARLQMSIEKAGPRQKLKLLTIHPQTWLIKKLRDRYSFVALTVQILNTASSRQNRESSVVLPNLCSSKYCPSLLLADSHNHE